MAVRPPRARGLGPMALAAIRRAGGTVLAAGAATPVLGAELVTNGTFDTATDWALSAGGGSSAITGGSLVLSGPTSSYPSAQQDILTAGKRYQITFTTTTAIASGALGVRIGGVASSSLTQVTAAGTYTIEGVADGPSLRPMRLSGFSDTVNITSISAKEILGYTHGNPPVRNYFDSAGTDILDSVTQIDQPVGLTLDGAGTVGVELAPAISLSNWQVSGADATHIATVSNGTVRYQSDTTSPQLVFGTQQPCVTVGKTYLVTVVCSAWTSGAVKVFENSGGTLGGINGVGTFSGVVPASQAYIALTRATANVDLTISSISVRELPGNHATQPTTGSKPALRRGLVNQLLWSRDFTNAAWFKTSVTVSGSALTTTAVDESVRPTTPITVTPGAVMTLAVSAKRGTATNVKMSVWNLTTPSNILASDSYYNEINASTFSIAVRTFTVPAGCTSIYVYPLRDSGSIGTTFVDGFALFSGTVTAQQILAAGGIPLTTTAPASSALGNYWWQFDPAAPGDFLQTSITTGNEGWVCAGVNFTDSNSTIVVSGAGSNAQKGIWAYRTASNDYMNMLVGNGTLVSNANACPMPANVPCVWEGWWTATTVGQAVNGVGAADIARTGDASPPPASLRIGAYTDGVTYAANGGISVTVICPTLPPPADRALIRAWVGSLQGQTL